MLYMVIRLGKVELVTDNKELAIEVATNLCAEVYSVSLVANFCGWKRK